ncbi:hypothetical protein [Halopseudomonas xiamenensis]|uniref:hypothetical protein n=1 Tax=Halopseudomonas xiamenensis TaxID=157792 RepID=UPI0016246CAF|nr:hypothetical protein [Halopseudomonas xiamenensis]
MAHHPDRIAAHGVRILLLWLLTAAPGLPAISSEASSPRQTEFSDRNYTPNRQINISKPTRPGAARAAASTDNRVIQSNMEKVAWVDARGAQTEYRMYYEHDSNTLDFASVCSNYRKGSIDYRNCRKAAKQWFGGKCNGGNSAGRMYCHARNGFLP